MAPVSTHLQCLITCNYPCPLELRTVQAFMLTRMNVLVSGAEQTCGRRHLLRQFRMHIRSVPHALHMCVNITIMGRCIFLHITPPRKPSNVPSWNKVPIEVNHGLIGVLYEKQAKHKASLNGCEASVYFCSAINGLYCCLVAQKYILTNQSTLMRVHNGCLASVNISLKRVKGTPRNIIKRCFSNQF